MASRAAPITFAGRAHAPRRPRLAVRRSLLEARALAAAIDVLLLLVPLVGAALALTRFAQLEPARTAALLAGPALAFVLSYFFVCEARCGRTLGKRRLGLRVRAEFGEPPGLGAVCVRTLMRPVDAFCLLGLALALATGASAGDWLGRTTVMFDAGIPLAPACRLSWRLVAFPALAAACALTVALASL